MNTETAPNAPLNSWPSSVGVTFGYPSEAMHRRVLETDVAIKTGQQEPTLALELLVTELAGEARSATPPLRGGRGNGARLRSDDSPPPSWGRDRG